MRLINRFQETEAILPDDLLEELKKLGLKHYPNECGGFLVGYYSDNFRKLHITNFILPKKQKLSPVFFERSSDGLREVFIKLFETQGYFYVGEWHTHPNCSSQYSQTDLTAMNEIVASEGVAIMNPVLLILSISQEKMLDFSMYFYDDKEMYKYEQG